MIAVPTWDRGGNDSTGRFANTSPIIDVQMRHGTEPPVICRNPPNGVIASTDPSSPTWYTATAPTICGVKPMNHADLLSVDVPVLPAMGRPSLRGVPAGAVEHHLLHRVRGVRHDGLGEDAARPSTSCA